jgi:proteasome accessory factor C
MEQLIALLSNNQASAAEVAFDTNGVDADLRVLQRAILTDRSITCRYVNSKGEESVRDIDPLLLVSEENLWYLRGYCHKNLGVRTFRLDHMVDAVITDKARRAEAIEAAKSLDETAPIYNPSDRDVEVELELAPEAYKLAGLVTQLSEPKAVGAENVRVTIKLGYLPDLGPLVCRFGTSARVIGPPEARAVVRKFAEQSLTGLNVDSE